MEKEKVSDVIFVSFRYKRQRYAIKCHSSAEATEIYNKLKEDWRYEYVYIRNSEKTCKNVVIKEKDLENL